MTKTTNYQLPQWETEDPVCREDFNGAMANIDAGITAARQAAKAAQGAADAAQGTADTARTEAAALPFVTGSYTGNLTKTKYTLGFRPSLVVIGKQYISSDVADTYSACSVFGGDGVENVLTIDSDGFTVIGNVKNYPAINWGGREYVYIAFR